MATTVIKDRLRTIGINRERERESDTDEQSEKRYEPDEIDR